MERDGWECAGGSGERKRERKKEKERKRERKREKEVGKKVVTLGMVHALTCELLNDVTENNFNIS